MLIKKALWQKISPSRDEEATEPENEVEEAETVSVRKRELEAQLAEMRREAEAQASQMLEEARSHKEAMIREAEASIQQRERESMEQSSEQMKELFAKAAQEIQELASLRESLVAQSKDFLIDLGVSLAGKILDRKVQEEPQILEQLLNSGMQELSRGKGGEHLIASVNPADEQLAREFAEHIASQQEGAVLEVHPDDSIAPGSCFLTGEAGAINMNFSSQLALFREKLAKAL